MGPRHGQGILGRPAQHLHAGGQGLGGHAVEFDGDLRLGELHGGVVHDVTPDEQLLALGLEQVTGVTRGVAVGLDGTHARQDLVGAGVGAQAVGLHVGRHRVLGRLEEALCGRGRLGHHRRVEPVVGIRLRDVHLGIGEGHLPLGRAQAANVVTVQVGQQDGIDLFRLVARSLQVGMHLPQAGAEELGGAGIDQHQLLAGVDQEGDHGCGRGRTAEGTGQQLRDFMGRGVFQQFAVKLDAPVVQCGDLELSHHVALVTRHLGAHLGGFGVHSRHGPQGQQAQRQGRQQA